ncbi:MAG: hypothetical protein HC919_12395 [Oscillatoriales cyanobacterium SM2_2_1]|nr:hypothetical protein [Oscillatoriales cyanobacterium SM2_2_1]
MSRSSWWLLLKTLAATAAISALIKFATGWLPSLTAPQMNVIAALVVTLPVLFYIVILQMRTDG